MRIRRAMLQAALGAGLLAGAARGEGDSPKRTAAKANGKSASRAPAAAAPPKTSLSSAGPPSSASAATATSVGAAPEASGATSTSAIASAQLPAPPLVARPIAQAGSPAQPTPRDFAKRDGALVLVEPPEPSLAEAQAAAEHLAAGDPVDDASRLSRARAAHWAPVVRGQLGGNTSDHNRTGTLYAEPLDWTDLGSGNTWAVTLTWDLPSAIYARDENQLALSGVHLARARREVAAEVSRLYVERQRRLASLRAGAARPRAELLEAALGLLESTAQLDSLCGRGLFAPALAQAQARLDSLNRSPEDLP